jgi:NAD(P)-dependent dehydrogenase (short-subunit alcohol dehydrogenase family)
LDLGLSGKIAIVTGGTGSLGHSVVKAFLENDVRVVTAYRSRDKLENLIGYMGELGDKLTGVEADVENEESVMNLVQHTIEEFGRVDILLNIVGGYKGGHTVADTTVEEFDSLIGINLKSAFLCSKHVLPHMMKENYGKILCVSARPAVDRRRRVKSGAYAISKAGVKILTETIAEEVRDYNIDVNCIMPSTMKTDENLRDFPGADTSKWVDTEDVAKVILFLVSDSSRVTSGAAIPVFGKS